MKNKTAYYLIVLFIITTVKVSFSQNYLKEGTYKYEDKRYNVIDSKSHKFFIVTNKNQPSIDLNAKSKGKWPFQEGISLRLTNEKEVSDIVLDALRAKIKTLSNIKKPLGIDIVFNSMGKPLRVTFTVYDKQPITLKDLSKIEDDIHKFRGDFTSIDNVHKSLNFLTYFFDIEFKD